MRRRDPDILAAFQPVTDERSLVDSRRPNTGATTGTRCRGLSGSTWKLELRGARFSAVKQSLVKHFLVGYRIFDLTFCMATIIYSVATDGKRGNCLQRRRT